MALNRRWSASPASASAKGAESGKKPLRFSLLISCSMRDQIKCFKTKLNVLKTCVFSTALYACEKWTIKKTDKDKIWPLKCTAIEEGYT